MCHRPREPDQGQRQHGRLARLELHRRGGREAALGRALGRRHGDGPLDGRRSRRDPQAIIRSSTVPIGTVPIYSMIIGRKIEDLDAEIVLESLEHQARQGVDYFTIHAGVLREHLPFVQRRLIGIVSRGGSLLAQVDAPPRPAEPDVRALGRDLRRSCAATTSPSPSATACVPAASPTPPTRPSCASSRRSASSPSAPGDTACR